MVPADDAPFGVALRRHRLSAGLTREELAERAGLSVRGLAYLETGQRRPYRDTVRRLAAALDLAAADLASFSVLVRANPASLDNSMGEQVALAGDQLPSFGTLLGCYRRERGLTQEELAAQAGVSVRTLSDLEREAKHRPRTDTVVLLVEALALSSDERSAFNAAARRLNLPAARIRNAGTALSVPIPPTPLIGRDRDVGAVCQLLQREEVRLLTLVGPAGVGKTRLALQVALELRAAFASGVAFAALASLTDTTLVAGTIATAVGSRPEENVTAALQGKKMLLLLDNFEHVVGAAPLLADLLAACSGLKMLVTSRTALHLRGEHVYPVPLLSLPPAALPPASLEAIAQSSAVTLFVQRAQALQPDFRITEANASAITAVCQRLDGLPLALELAAPRLRLLTPQALLARLEQTYGSTPLLSLLTGGAQDLPARQQTLRNAIAWSYDLLSADEQALFRGLAVFVNGCTLEAAEAVCAPDCEHDDLLDRLITLIDQNLLWVQEQDDPAMDVPETRIGMLETIREYGLERLVASGELQACQREHATYYLTVAETAEQGVTGPEQARWVARLERDLDNIRAALRWAWQTGDDDLGMRLAGALQGFWLVHRNLSEGRRWLVQFLARDAQSKGVAIPVRAKALQAAGVLAYRQGDHEGATVPLEESLGICRIQGDVRGVAQSLNYLGMVVRYRGDYERAATLFEESVELYRRLGRRWSLGLALNNLAVVVRYRGDYARSAALSEESLALWQDHKDTFGVALARTNLAHVAQTQGDDALAAAQFQEGLLLFKKVGDKLGMAWCLEGMAGVLSRQKSPPQAPLQQAARLWGAAAFVRKLLDTPLSPTERRLYDHDVAAVRRALGDDAFDAAWEEGHRLSPEQAVAAAEE